MDGSSDVVQSLNELGKDEEEPMVSRESMQEDLVNRLDAGGNSSSQEDFSDFKLVELIVIGKV